MMHISLLVFCASFLVPGVASNEVVDFTCQVSQYLSRVESDYDISLQDRIWSYQCRDLPTGTQLGQSTWYNGNQYLQDLNFDCPGTSVITGVHSVYSTTDIDRAFTFRCSSLENVQLGSCETTAFINQEQGVMDYTVTGGYAIVGFESVYGDIAMDRRWKVKKCLLQ